MTMRKKVNLAGKVAVVTGDGRGLGRASALAFAAGKWKIGTLPYSGTSGDVV
jgi:NAD(P)-dependent dehydrogenase (short-subunit alcohol dehydrogenase family)